mmetsp:Transcript_2777/g.8376  ORF Transcript_2777/g.8376 Transcript_2777/m.8376 type:complete len:685 (-) Transcript_2777:687-2741(-)
MSVVPRVGGAVLRDEHPGAAGCEHSLSQASAARLARHAPGGRVGHFSHIAGGDARGAAAPSEHHACLRAAAHPVGEGRGEQHVVLAVAVHVVHKHRGAEARVGQVAGPADQGDAVSVGANEHGGGSVRAGAAAECQQRPQIERIHEPGVREGVRGRGGGCGDDQRGRGGAQRRACAHGVAQLAQRLHAAQVQRGRAGERAVRRAAAPSEQAPRLPCHAVRLEAGGAHKQQRRARVRVCGRAHGHAEPLVVLLAARHPVGIGKGAERGGGGAGGVALPAAGGSGAAAEDEGGAGLQSAARGVPAAGARVGCSGEQVWRAVAVHVCGGQRVAELRQAAVASDGGVRGGGQAAAAAAEVHKDGTVVGVGRLGGRRVAEPGHGRAHCQVVHAVAVEVEGGEGLSEARVQRLGRVDQGGSGGGVTTGRNAYGAAEGGRSTAHAGHADGDLCGAVAVKVALGRRCAQVGERRVTGDGGGGPLRAGEDPLREGVRKAREQRVSAAQSAALAVAGGATSVAKASSSVGVARGGSSHRVSHAAAEVGELRARRLRHAGGSGGHAHVPLGQSLEGCLQVRHRLARHVGGRGGRAEVRRPLVRRVRVPSEVRAVHVGQRAQRVQELAAGLLHGAVQVRGEQRRVRLGRRPVLDPAPEAASHPPRPDCHVVKTANVVVDIALSHEGGWFSKDGFNE